MFVTHKLRTYETVYVSRFRAVFKTKRRFERVALAHLDALSFRGELSEFKNYFRRKSDFKY